VDIGRERVESERLLQLVEHQLEKLVWRVEEIGNREWAAVFWIRKRPKVKGAAADAKFAPREKEGDWKEKVCGGNRKRR
jgi:hypothetical protein